MAGTKRAGAGALLAAVVGASSAFAAAPPLPVIPNRTFDVTTFGATGGDTTEDTSALQAAINAAGSAGGGTVLVPAGTYMSGPISLGSNINLDLATGATLKMLPMATYTSEYSGATNFITMSHVTNAEITGSGTIEGQGSAWWTAYTANNSISRPRMVNTTGSTTVAFTGITLQNSPEFNLAFGTTSNVTIDGVKISNPATSPNTDGIDAGGSHFLIQNCNISTGDDNVVAKPGNTVCSDITITHDTFGAGHGVSIGGQTNLGLNGMTVSNCTFNGTSNGVRLKAGRGFGGLVENVSFSNLTMTNVAHPIDITSYYLNGGTASQPTNPATDPAQAVNSLTPIWENISLSNITDTGASEIGIVYGLPEEPVEGITFNNVDISAAKGLELFNVRNAFVDAGSAFTVSSGAKELTFNATFATPEPGTVGVLGAAVVGFLRRRRRNSKC